MKKYIENKKSKSRFLFKIEICFALFFAMFLSLNASNISFAKENTEFCYLSDISAKSAVVGDKTLLLDKNYNGKLITVSIDGEDKTFFKGVFAHAASTVIYDLTNYNYDYFTAYIGGEVDNRASTQGDGFTFEIYTSNDETNWTEILNDNTNFSKKKDSKFVKLNIKGAKYLKLVAKSGRNNWSDHAVYANAKLIKEGYVESENEKVDFIKTTQEYDQIIKSHEGEEITGEYELTLLQREFVSNVGYDYLQFFAGYNNKCKETLRWLMTDLENMRLYVLGGKPDGDNYPSSLTILAKLYEEYSSDFTNTELLNNPTTPNMTYGYLYKKMAMSIALTHSQTVGLWMNSSNEVNKSEPLRRYAIFKYLHKNGGMRIASSMDMTHVFEDLHVQEMRLVLYNNIDDEEILWLNRYTQDNIDANPNNVWRYQTPHPYIAYVWPNYANPVYYDPANTNYFNELFAVKKTDNNKGTELVNAEGQKTGKIGIFDSEFVIPGGANIPEYRIKVSKSVAGQPNIYKVWMNFRNKFGTGCVCGGISKSGANIRGVHGIPAMVVGQPGHAALMFYSKDTQGRGYWRIDNDVSGWTLSGGGGRLLRWGNSNTDGYSNGVYVELEQAAINDYENLMKAEKLVMLAKLYANDPVKQEELYRKALEIQSINFDAWLGLINSYKANEAKTEDNFYALAEEVAENLTYFPLPMYNATNLIKPKLTSIENNYKFTLLQTRTLNEAKNLPNNTTTSFTVMQPGVTRLEAGYLLGQLDTSIASFSFDGDDAGKIVLSSRFDGSGVRWDYSLDGKQTWTEVSFTAEEEHKLQLTQKQLESITAENDIYVHIVGVNYDEKNLYKIDIQESAGFPATLYANDLENKLIAASPVMKWKLNENDPWTLYSEAEPDLSGNKTVTVKVAATGVYLESRDERSFNFTANNDPDTRQYIPISHLSIHAVSTEATSQQGAATFAIDGNANTRYHSAWNGTDTQRFITIKLDKPVYLSAVEYIPAAGGNGKIYDGTIYGSMDGENWEILSRQTNLLYNNQANTVDQAIANTKSFEVDNPSKVQYVKIVADRTNGNWFAARMFNFFEDTTTQVAGNFSFDGENAGKIMLEAGLEEEAWKYSLDAGSTWKPANGIEHQLTAEEISQINENDEIKIKLDSDGSKGTIHIKKGHVPTITPYVNDWENRLIGLDNCDALEWKLQDGNTWKSYADEEPVVLGNKKLLVRTKATGIYTASDVLEYQFTEDANTPKETYIPISHLSVDAYTSQSIDSSRPYYAVNAIDGNPNTLWHTDFRYALPSNRASYTIKLDSNKYISALEYKQNGYRENDPVYSRNVRVYVGENGVDWIQAGSLENVAQNADLKKIAFAESVSGQYVKIEMDGYGIFAALSMVNLYEDTTVKKVGSFSFDGENANKIILVDEFQGSNWEYSLDGGTTWKRGTADTHTLTQEEVEQVNGDNKIKVKINNVEYLINIQKSITPTIAAYANDLENRLIGIGNTENLEWKIEGTENWKDYGAEEPVVEGDAKLLIRKKARGIFAPSDIVEFDFTADHQEDTRKYVSVNHLSIAGFSAEDKGQNGAAVNAIDGNYNTRWLNSSAGTDTEKYIIIKFDTAKYISAMDYVPHLENGKILSGRILGSMDGENFTEIAQISGWSNNQATKTIDFDEAVKVRYVKIIGEETSYTSAKRHVGARMFNFYEDTTKKEVVIPTAEIEYSTINKTNQNVVAKLVNPSTEITVLNNNGSTEYTFTENGTFTFEFEDSEGNKGKSVAIVDWICKTLPEAILEYDIPTPTNQDVTVTVKFKVNGEFNDDVTILNNDGSNTHTFTENGDFTFNFRGPYGNEGSVTASVDWICKTLPNATFTYDINETTNQDVTVTVTFDRENVTITNNDGKNTHTFTENGEFTFEFVGPYGNSGIATAKVDWIDKTVPTANITYDITELTNRNVVATLNCGEEITITNNNGNKAHTFTKNGEFTFEFVNQLGNKGTATAKVNWIDKQVPNARISYNITEATNQSVIATIRFDKENVTVEGGNTHTFTENGEYTFEFVDQAGNTGTAIAKVDWIDKTLPVATITYSTTNPTNQNVIATIHFDKENVTVEGGNTHTFTQNGEYDFRFVGPSGNTGVAKAKVTWIDKEAPQPIMVYSTINPTNQDVTAKITFENKENVTITNNSGKDTYTFTENGEFRFEYMDEAGNKGAVNAIVNWIDKTAPTATVSYDITEKTNGNVIATLENVSEEITITNNDGNNTYTFTKNGEFTFEFVDEAGNTGTAKATVSWIDRTLPIATITYSTTDPTDQDVVATIRFNKENVTVAGGNTHTFTENGEFTFEFVDEAGNAGMKTATVTWIEKEPDVPNPPVKIEGITSETYRIEEGFISRILPQTTISQFIENVETEEDLVFLNKDGNELGENDILATGMTLKVGTDLQFTLIVIGDTDGNGKLTITDMARLKLHYIGKQPLEGNDLKAADIDGNEKVTLTDLAQMKLVLIGKVSL